MSVLGSNILCAAVVGSLSAVLNPHEHGLQTSAKNIWKRIQPPILLALHDLSCDPLLPSSYESDSLVRDIDPHPMLLNHEGG